MKNMGTIGIIVAVLGVAVILLIDVVMGRAYQIGYKSIIGLVVCVALFIFGLRTKKQKVEA